MRMMVIVALLFGLVSGGCSKAPALTEEEFLKVLAEVNRVGPLNFRKQVWPLLEKKAITYCGPLEEARVVGTESVLRFKIDKLSSGEKLPWLLEGKSVSSDLVPPPQVGESVCMTGILEGFMYRDPSYWGYVKIQSVEKQHTS